jgi:hypothetical protein
MSSGQSLAAEFRMYCETEDKFDRVHRAEETRRGVLSRTSPKEPPMPSLGLPK